MGSGNEINRDGRSMSKEELQQKVEQKREEIAHTVDEIRHTLSDEVRDRKQSMKQVTDWHYYVNKAPIVAVGGAVAVGFFVGKALGNKLFEHPPEPTWRDRAHDLSVNAERKLDEWRGRAQGESKWKARSRSMFSSSSDLLMRELMKTAQHMIMPTIVAAITGKMASDKKTTVVEKNVVKTPAGMPDHEVTTGVTEFDHKKDKITRAEGTAPDVDLSDSDT